MESFYFSTYKFVPPCQLTNQSCLLLCGRGGGGGRKRNGWEGLTGLALMLSDTASSGCGRCLKLIQFGVGMNICLFFRDCLPSLGISLQFPWSFSNLICTQGHCWHAWASPGAHLRQSPFSLAPGWLFLSHVGHLLLCSQTR